MSWPLRCGRGADGRPVPDAPEISAAETYRRAAHAFDAVLCLLGGDDWRTPVLRGLDVQDLVGHLIGVEDDAHRALDGDPEVAGAGHVEFIQAAAIGQAARPPAGTRADWRRAAGRTLGLVRSADSRTEVGMHGMRLPLGGLLVVRVFELWTHENDIRQAAGWVGRGASVPSAVFIVTDAVWFCRLVANRVTPPAWTYTSPGIPPAPSKS